jgi:hypothetical protein
MNILILDDDQCRHDMYRTKINPVHTLYHAHNAIEAGAILGNPETPIDFMLLDHDLGDGVDGYEFVRSIGFMTHYLRRPAAIVHSMNSVGGPAMVSHLALLNIFGAYLPGLFGRGDHIINAIIDDMKERVS